MITSKRVLAAGFVAALGLAGLGLGASNAGASADMMGGGLCDGIDLSTLTGGAAAGSAAQRLRGTDGDRSRERHRGRRIGAPLVAERRQRRRALRRHRPGRQVVQRRRRRRARPGRRRLRRRPHRVDAVERRRPGRAPERRRRRRQRPGDRASASCGATPSPRPPPAAPDTHFGIVDSVVDSPNVASLVVRRGAGLVPGRRRRGAEVQDRPRRLRRRRPERPDPEVRGRLRGRVRRRQPRHRPSRSQYITRRPDFIGFNDPARGKEIAAAMYEAGADVVYAAAGASGSACSRRPPRPAIRATSGRSASTATSTSRSTPTSSRTC